MDQLNQNDTPFPAWLTLSWAWAQSLDDPAAVTAALARNLRRYREERRLSQKKLARRTGTSLTTIREIEAARILPPIALMIRLGDALGVSCSALVETPAAEAPARERFGAPARPREAAAA